MVDQQHRRSHMFVLRSSMHFVLRAFLVIWALLSATTTTLLHSQNSFPILPADVAYYMAVSGNNSNSQQEERKDEYKLHVDKAYQKYNFEVDTPTAPVCYPLRAKDVDFTLVTQLSDDRLAMMRPHCKRWGKHTISLAIGTNESRDTVEQALSKSGCDTALITLSIVRDFDSDQKYPVNKLRNVAMSQVRTSHAVIIDADFVLSPNLYETLHLHNKTLAADSTNALVIPSFELRKACRRRNRRCITMYSAMVPRNKDGLLELYDPMTEDSAGYGIAQFDIRGNYHGHASTRYADWASQPAEQLLPIECVTSDRYEPYLVVRHCRDLPPFQEAFVGYGQNKLTWMQQVRRRGYKLFQVGEVFAVHLPHSKSPAFKQWHMVGKANRSSLAVTTIADAFGLWMNETVPDFSQVPYCS